MLSAPMRLRIACCGNPNLDLLRQGPTVRTRKLYLNHGISGESLITRWTRGDDDSRCGQRSGSVFSTRTGRVTLTTCLSTHGSSNNLTSGNREKTNPLEPRLTDLHDSGRNRPKLL